MKNTHKLIEVEAAAVFVPIILMDDQDLAPHIILEKLLSFEN